MKGQEGPGSTAGNEWGVSEVGSVGKSMRCSSPQAVICYGLIGCTGEQGQIIMGIFTCGSLSRNSFYQEVTGNGGSGGFFAVSNSQG